MYLLGYGTREPQSEILQIESMIDTIAIITINIIAIITIHRIAITINIITITITAIITIIFCRIIIEHVMYNTIICTILYTHM